MIMKVKLTVFFDDPFWVGVCELENRGKYEVCKITFGSEPKDYEVYEFLLSNWSKLKFSTSTETKLIFEKRINPKRMQRAIKKQLQDTGIGTKAQQTLKIQQEEGKSKRKSLSRKQKEEEKERQFEIHLEKQKAKHKGH